MMTQNNVLIKLHTFWKSNWFKLILFGIFLFALLKSDFHFEINVQSKDAPPTELPSSTSRGVITLASEMDGQIQKSSMDILSFSPVRQGETARQVIPASIDPEVIQSFINRFTPVAKAEQSKYGIPASVILANGILHSQAGQTGVTRRGNNYFGLTCSPQWKGGTTSQDGICYRTYESAWFSFRDHSLYLTSGRFSRLASLSPRDYSSWAKALEELQFSGYQNLSQSLIFIIRKFDLARLDS